jgi:very-short-patch-repair endonuclease
VGAEFDGLEAHMTARQLQEDRRRHNWLTDRRWKLLHFTGADVYRRPADMIGTAAAALGLSVSRGRRGDQLAVERHSRERRAVT